MTHQLNPSAHAYRVGYSTTTTMIEVTNRLYEATDRCEISSLMTIDQSAAFDCITHEILLQKLKIYKIGDGALSWIQDYLAHRSQFTSIGRTESRMEALSRGVPQGSVLGPLLYSVFTNELTECIVDPSCRNTAHSDPSKLFSTNCLQCGSIQQYADDTTYVFSSRIRNRNREKLVRNLTNLEDFLTSNFLAINTKKTNITEVMIGQKRCKTPGSPTSEHREQWHQGNK